MALPAGNAFDDLPDHLPDELVEVLAAGSGARVERIVSRGHATPEHEWYDQDDDELVVVLDGAAELQIDGEGAPRRLERGDWLLLPAHVRHRVTWTDGTRATIWLAVFLPPDDGG